MIGDVDDVPGKKIFGDGDGRAVFHIEHNGYHKMIGHRQYPNHRTVAVEVQALCWPLDALNNRSMRNNNALGFSGGSGCKAYESGLIYKMGKRTDSSMPLKAKRNVPCFMGIGASGFDRLCTCLVVDDGMQLCVVQDGIYFGLFSSGDIGMLTAAPQPTPCKQAHDEMAAVRAIIPGPCLRGCPVP